MIGKWSIKMHIPLNLYNAIVDSIRWDQEVNGFYFYYSIMKDMLNRSNGSGHMNITRNLVKDGDQWFILWPRSGIEIEEFVKVPVDNLLFKAIKPKDQLPSQIVDELTIQAVMSAL